MANPSLQIGNEKWATKDGSLLGYNITDSDRYIPIPADVSRGSKATYVDSDGLIKTNEANVARIDYSSGEGVLLTEPQSTNLVKYSEDFTDSSWNEINTTTSKSYIASPKGNADVDLIQSTSTSSCYITTSATYLTLVVGNTYAFSCFAKKGNNDWIRMAHASSSVNASWFDLENGVVGTVNGISGSIEDYGNGWYRCTVVFDAYQATGGNIVFVGVCDADGSINAGASGKNNYIWGAQVEEQSYATSYIPTNGAVATRLADECSDAGTSDTFNDSEGVLYVLLSDIKSQNFSSIIINNGIADENNQVRIWFYNNTITYQYKVGSDVSAQITTSAMDLTLDAKIACSWKLNEFKLFVNGSKINEDLSGDVLANNTLESIEFNRGNNTGSFYGNVKDLRVYNTALTDAELEELTQ